MLAPSRRYWNCLQCDCRNTGRECTACGSRPDASIPAAVALALTNSSTSYGAGGGHANPYTSLLSLGRTSSSVPVDANSARGASAQFPAAGGIPHTLHEKSAAGISELGSILNQASAVPIMTPKQQSRKQSAAASAAASGLGGGGYSPSPAPHSPSAAQSRRPSHAQGFHGRAAASTGTSVLGQSATGIHAPAPGGQIAAGVSAAASGRQTPAAVPGAGSRTPSVAGSVAASAQPSQGQHSAPASAAASVTASGHGIRPAPISRAVAGSHQSQHQNRGASSSVVGDVPQAPVSPAKSATPSVPHSYNDDGRSEATTAADTEAEREAARVAQRDAEAAAALAVEERRLADIAAAQEQAKREAEARARAQAEALAAQQRRQVDDLKSALRQSQQYGSEVERAIEHLAELLKKKTMECEGLRALASDSYTPLKNAVRREYETRVRTDARQQQELARMQAQLDKSQRENTELAQELRALHALEKELRMRPAATPYDPSDNSFFNRALRDAGIPPKPADQQHPMGGPRSASGGGANAHHGGGGGGPYHGARSGSVGSDGRSPSQASYHADRRNSATVNSTAAGGAGTTPVSTSRQLIPPTPQQGQATTAAGGAGGSAGGAAANSWDAVTSDTGAPMAGARRELAAFLAAMNQETSDRLQRAGVFDIIRATLVELCTPDRNTGIYPEIDAAVSAVVKLRRTEGPEAVSRAASRQVSLVTVPPRQEAIDLFLQHRPDGFEELNALLDEYGGREEELVVLLRDQFAKSAGGVGAPAASVSFSGMSNVGMDAAQTHADLQARIVLMYKKYNPGKIATPEIGQMMQKYPAEVLLAALVNKYGPEPHGQEKLKLVKSIVE